MIFYPQQMENDLCYLLCFMICRRWNWLVLIRAAAFVLLVLPKGLYYSAMFSIDYNRHYMHTKHYITAHAVLWWIQYLNHITNIIFIYALVKK